MTKNVCFIGCGIVNLICAYKAAQQGYSIKFIDSGPDPRSKPSWTDLNCSSGGGNARMFTLTEMDNYNIRNDADYLFENNVTNLGWNISPENSLSDLEHQWIQDFRSLSQETAHNYNQDIFEFNAESKLLWDEWITKEPELFYQALFKDKILRLYSDLESFSSAIQRQNSVNATIKILSPDQISRQQPILRTAIENKLIVGGILVHGFTINVHPFIDVLIKKLETMFGAVFLWNTKVKSIFYDNNDAPKYIELDGYVIPADHLVISPGAYGNDMLRGTKSHNKICGVIGGWLTLPDPFSKLKHSLKLSRPGHVVEDANITIGRNEIIIGSGYGFTGFKPDNIDQNLLHELYEGIVNTASTYFPEEFQRLSSLGLLNDSLKYCVRGWTANSLGIFEIKGHELTNKCIITGGHNTGGFAQAPSIAEAVLAALENTKHDMHVKYHPER